MKIEIQPPALNTSPTDGNYTSALQLIHLLNTANATTGRKEADLNVKNKKIGKKGKLNQLTPDMQVHCRSRSNMKTKSTFLLPSILMAPN